MALAHLIEQSAQVIWDYHLLNHALVKSDCILVLGSNDVRVAERGAELYLAGFAPLVIFSGAVGKLTEGKFDCSEAQQFANIAMEMGVPASAILILISHKAPLLQYSRSTII